MLERAGAGEAARDAAAGWQDDRVVFFSSKEDPLDRVGFLWRIRATSPTAARRIATLLSPLYSGRPIGQRPLVTTRGDVVEVSLTAVRLPAA